MELVELDARIKEVQEAVNQGQVNYKNFLEQTKAMTEQSLANLNANVGRLLELQDLRAKIVNKKEEADKKADVPAEATA